MNQMSNRVLATGAAVAGAAALATGIALTTHAPGPTVQPEEDETAIAGIHPGSERWAVKTGADPDVQKVNLNPVDATVEQLIALPGNPKGPDNSRIAPTELTTYRVSGTITGCKLETDGDFHIVLQGTSGKTMIVEVPYPQFLPSDGPWDERIGSARSIVDAKFSPKKGKLQVQNAAVTVTGVGFFDHPHGQDGVAPNAIELHPVLNVVWK